MASDSVVASIDYVLDFIGVVAVEVLMAHRAVCEKSAEKDCFNLSKYPHLRHSYYI